MLGSPVGAEVQALLDALALKSVDRAGWVRAGVARPESVADHSWGVAFLVAALLPEELDLGRAMAYAVLHDLAEVTTGDITPFDGVLPQEKAAREDAAMVALCASLPNGSRLLRLWRSYEGREDAEALFVAQLDRLDLGLMAVRYGASQGGFDESARNGVSHPRLVDLLLTAQSRRRSTP